MLLDANRIRQNMRKQYIHNSPHAEKRVVLISIIEIMIQIHVVLVQMDYEK